MVIDEKLKHEFDRTFNDKELDLLNALRLLNESDDDILWSCRQLLIEDKRNKLTVFTNKGLFKKYKNKNRVCTAEWVSALGYQVQKELKEAHNIIIKNFFPYECHRAFNNELLQKLWYFKSKQGIFFATQIDIIYRKLINEKEITMTEILKSFDPVDMFIDYAKNLKELKKEFLNEWRGKSYDQLIGQSL